MNSFSRGGISDHPKVSIGLPAYNGEQYIRKTLNSILEQTFTDFELIISDDASIDSTSVICKEYLNKDKRIRYFHQEKNIGMLHNHYFVLQKARGDYFVWIAHDDFWHPNFLEKNIHILESQKNMVGSISKINYHDMQDLLSDESFSLVKEYLRKKALSLRSSQFPITGTYEKKVRMYLMSGKCTTFYGVFRIDKLRNSIVDVKFPAFDWAVVLNVLRYGDFHELDETLLYRSYRGMSGRSLSKMIRHFDDRILAIIFPNYSFTYWCAKYLGVKIFLRNLDRFILLNLEGEVSILIDSIRSLILPINRLLTRRTINQRDDRT